MRAGIAGLGAACLTAAGTFAGAFFYADARQGDAAAMATVELEGAKAVPLAMDEGQEVPSRSWLRRLGMRAAPTVDVTIPIDPLTIPLRGTLDGEMPDAVPAEPHVIPPQKSIYPFGTQYASEAVARRVASKLVVKTPRSVAVSDTPPPLKHLSTASLRPAEIGGGQPALADIDNSVIERFRANLPRDLYANFDLFIYVSKADRGPIAQRMYVLKKTRTKNAKASHLTLLHSWLVSTGREAIEYSQDGHRMSTGTPEGFYQLDPERLYRRYKSFQWGLQMPNSMFFNWVDRGRKTGLAIHGVAEEQEIDALGSRFSAGCVHLPPEAAQSLFNLVRANYRGQVPRFAYDPVTKTLSNEGKLARDKRGALRMTNGYRVLVYVENYGGTETTLSNINLDSSKPNG
jgi:L,D-transpeptidase catalytic domain